MRILLFAVVLAVACSRGRRSEPAAQPTVRPQPTRTQPAPARASTSASRSITGSYRFSGVNKSRVPAEFPPGSGAQLESGSLELQSNNRFAMRFNARPKGATEARSSGENGRYRIGRDTLYFTVDGRETQPPVTFRFVRTSAGLNLIDTKGNTWVYVRN